MRTLFPAASACFVVVFVASVGYAETKIEAKSDKIADAANAAETQRSTVHELSTAPSAHITYPDDRPEWIGRQPDLESSVHTWVVSTSGCESMEMCEAQLEALIPANVSLYIKETTGWVCDDDFLDADWIENQLVSKRYVGTLQQGDHELHEIAVELNFDADSRGRIRRAYQNSVVDDRLRATGGLFALALIGLCCTGSLLGVISRRYT
ncbi:MAG: hypothetical protein KDB00_11135 [Planctomycetales bacterium]|nr:hypothetical protein [Planctomycetales bacterium]